MLQNDILSDRLNSVKQGEDLPEIKPKEPLIEEPENCLTDSTFLENKFPRLMKIAEESVHIVSSSMRSFAYGFALHTIFDTNWTILGMLAIGYSIEVLTNKIFYLLKK